MESPGSIRNRSSSVDSGDRLLQGGLFVVSTLASVAYWAMEDFRARTLGDADWAITICDAAATDPSILLRSFGEVTRLAFLVPFCGAYHATGQRLWVWVLVQIALYATGVVMLYRIGREVQGPTTGIVAAVGAALLWETFRFTRRTQSDTVFIVALVFAVYALTRRVNGDGGRVPVFVGFGLVALTRPVGLAVVLGWVTLAALPEESRFHLPVGLDRRLVAASVLVIVTAMYSSGMVSLTGGLDFNLHWFWERGIVVTHTTEPTYHYGFTPRPSDDLLTFVLFNLDHLIIMGLLRVAWVFVPVLSRWSTFHILVNVVTVTPVVLLGLLGVYDAVDARDRKPLVLWFVPLLMLLGVIAVTWLDGGFNYRAPISVLLALFAGYAIQRRKGRIAGVANRFLEGV